MTAEEIIRGESLNVVFMKFLPDKNEKMLKAVVAFANSSGGKLIIGVEDDTRTIVSLRQCLKNPATASVSFSRERCMTK